jgi:Fe-S-cluster-containing dehydrogenase component
MKQIWQSLEAGSMQEHEFPTGHSAAPEGLNRREFLRLGALTAALAGCSTHPGAEAIVPYVRRPDELAVSDTLTFATSRVKEGLAVGLLATSFQGRPIKLDGNPEHPASLGGTSTYDQALTASLYDPARARAVKRSGAASSWKAFAQWVQEKGVQGAHVLTPVTTSPAEARLLARLKALGVGHTQYEPLFSVNEERGCELAFGRPLTPLYNFAGADLVVSLDADFLHEGGAALAHARAFASRRRPPAGRPRNFHYAVECSPTITGAQADKRLALSPSALALFAPSLFTDPPAEVRGRLSGKTIFIAGASQPAWIHALCHARNARTGAPVKYIEPVKPLHAGIEPLLKQMNAGEVRILYSLGGNPSYNAYGFAAALSKVTHHVRLSDSESETAEWFLPESHCLEAWGDSLAFEGTLTYQQPLIEPLGDTRSRLEVLALLAGEEKNGREIVNAPVEALSKGFAIASPRHPATVSARAVNIPAPTPAPAWELVFRPDFHLLDGRGYANSWLQELPRPLTELSWGNAALLSPRDAAKLGAVNGRRLKIEAYGKSLFAPAWVQPGHPEGSVTLTLGYGQSRPGMEITGYDAYPLFTASAVPGKISLADGFEKLVTTQEHSRVETGEPVKIMKEGEAAVPTKAPLSLYPEAPQPQAANAWGMVIDLARCTGCKACVAACQAENNIPVVGKEGVSLGREMHWIRVDRYFSGPAEDPVTYFQPVPCMHCEKAPCEPVCPAQATLHSDEGLNQMVYNRCVGTRYCSNNCPYKVRRFNFLEYNAQIAPVEKLGKNPDVSVRSRGVMEKCSYCVQRITRAKIDAEGESRPVRDGEITTACQAACPSEAIVFGNIKDPESRVSQARRVPGHYALLEELGTRPRTTYLPKLVPRA